MRNVGSKLEAAWTGNWFPETPLVVARLDMLSRNEDLQAKLEAPDCGWDLVVCDEAHKLSATFFRTSWRRKPARETLLRGSRRSGPESLPHRQHFF